MEAKSQREEKPSKVSLTLGITLTVSEAGEENGSSGPIKEGPQETPLVFNWDFFRDIPKEQEPTSNSPVLAGTETRLRISSILMGLR